MRPAARSKIGTRFNLVLTDVNQTCGLLATTLLPSTL
jgi:hypothetical protein